MAILPIYVYNQPVLRKKAKALRPDRVDRHALEKLARDMFETMRNASGIGLAANQVGSLHRVVVIDLSEMEETKEMEPIVLINPEVVEESGERTMEEGCLSIPEIRDEVTRPDDITVRFKDLEFRDQELKGTGMLTRVLLHEIDHLNGILFIDRLDAEKRKLLRGRLNKLTKGEFEAAYPVVGAALPVLTPTAGAKSRP